MAHALGGVGHDQGRERAVRTSGVRGFDVQRNEEESFGLLPPRNGRSDYEANQRDGWSEQANSDQPRETWSKRGLRSVIRPVRQSLGRQHRSVDGYQKRQRYEKHPPEKRAIPLESVWRRQRHNPEHSRRSRKACWVQREISGMTRDRKRLALIGAGHGSEIDRRGACVGGTVAPTASSRFRSG